MIKDPDILKEIQEISPLVAGLHGANVFRVPEGYFNSIADNVMDAVKIPGINIDKNSIQNVPQGYFESLSSNIMQRIRTASAPEESEQDSYPVLITCGKHNVLTVPQGYFESLPDMVLAKIKAEKASKVIPLFTHKIWRYAAAAIVAAGIFTTSYFMIKNRTSDANGFASVNSSTVPDPAALQFNSAKAFNEGIASLTDDEIINYLEEHGNILDNNLLLKNTDENELPDAADYFLNEQALTNYLDKINNTGSQKQ